MLKLILITQKIIFTILIGTFLTSCNSKKENFDIDLSALKIPNKIDLKIQNSKISDTAKTKNELVSYQNKSEVLNSIKFGKNDPFSEGEVKVNSWISDIKLTGFLSTKINKFAFINYLGREGTINSKSLGGVNTFLLPNGAKVINIDPINLKLTINFENQDYILEL